MDDKLKAEGEHCRIDGGDVMPAGFADGDHPAEVLDAYRWLFDAKRRATAAECGKELWPERELDGAELAAEAMTRLVLMGLVDKAWIDGQWGYAVRPDIRRKAELARDSVDVEVLWDEKGKPKAVRDTHRGKLRLRYRLVDDPETWCSIGKLPKKGCNKCHGTGIVGFNLTTKRYSSCTCIKGVFENVPKPNVKPRPSIVQ